MRAEYLIRTCGVRVAFSSELERDLRESGAEENLIAAVRDVAPKPVMEEKPKPAHEPQHPPAPAGAAKVDIRNGYHSA